MLVKVGPDIYSTKSSFFCDMDISNEVTVHVFGCITPVLEYIEKFTGVTAYVVLKIGTFFK